jgi:putative flippase GtrA
MNTVTIAILINILAISVSFTTQKIFVFQKKGNWLKEYLRSWIIYGGSAIFNVLGLWLFVDIFQIPISLAFLIVTTFLFVFIYLGHSIFTFKI